MILIKITGGLGNQMFQYSIGRALSIKLNCELVLDLSFYPKQSLRKYELEKFNISARIATQEDINRAGAGDSIFSRLIHKFHLTPFVYPKYFKESESMKYLDAINDCVEGTYLDGYWQNPNYFKDYYSTLLQDFTPVKRDSLIVDKWKSRIKESNSVSLHVRRGDYIENSHTNNVHGVCSLEYYKKAIHLFESNGENISYYIFSDDIKWCKENFDFIDNCYFIEDTVSPIDDLTLMRLCQGNIIANSTFSWWGAWLNPVSSVTVAPRKWFASKTKNAEGIYPEFWHII